MAEEKSQTIDQWLIEAYEGHADAMLEEVTELMAAQALPDEDAPSFWQTARNLKLDGPPDWSSRLDDYLYGDGSREQDG